MRCSHADTLRLALMALESRSFDICYEAAGAKCERDVSQTTVARISSLRQCAASATVATRDGCPIRRWHRLEHNHTPSKAHLGHFWVYYSCNIVIRETSHSETPFAGCRPYYNCPSKERIGTPSTDYDGGKWICAIADLLKVQANADIQLVLKDVLFA